MPTIIDGTAGITFPVTAGSASAVQASSGRVLQVVSATYSTEVVKTNGTLVDTGLTATITPSNASNKILVLLNQNGLGKSADNTANDIIIRLYRGATLIASPTQYATFTATAIEAFGFVSTLSYLDSPATTSATTYKTQFANYDGGGAVYVQRSGAISTITLMEIAV